MSNFYFTVTTSRLYQRCEFESVHMHEKAVNSLCWWRCVSCERSSTRRFSSTMRWLRPPHLPLIRTALCHAWLRPRRYSLGKQPNTGGVTQWTPLGGVQNVSDRNKGPFRAVEMPRSRSHWSFWHRELDKQSTGATALSRGHTCAIPYWIRHSVVTACIFSRCAVCRKWFSQLHFQINATAEKAHFCLWPWTYIFNLPRYC